MARAMPMRTMTVQRRQGRTRRAWRRWVSVTTVISHLLLSGAASLPSAALAQASDGEPPTISVERIEEGILGERQVFSANVADDVSIDSVTLHYRLGNESAYERVTMTPLVGTDIYTASVETSGTDADVLQYYIEARDAAGNRSIQGFAFDPIERRLVASPGALLPVVPPPRAEGMSTGRKVLYGVLGVLAVGALAAAVGGDSGGGSDAPPSSDDPDNAPLDIIVDPLP